MPAVRTDSISVPDGQFDGHIWLPDGGRGPGLLLLQEIFGVGKYLRAVGDRLADLGYVVLAPDLFWRIEPNVELEHDEDGLNRAMGYVQQFDFEAGAGDLAAALAHLRTLPEVGGRPVGVIGFCFGGRLAYHLAAHADPAVAVSYYGSGIADAVGEVPNIGCPILFHFGDNDPYIPNDQVDRIRDACAGKPDAEVHVHQGAGHAFDNHEAGMFHQPDAAAAAWQITTDFLARHIPPS
jgi:carboxymethylenebutenolidase